MTKREFQLRGPEETKCFELFLDQYRESRGLHPHPKLPLAHAHDVLVDHPEGARIFVSLFDLQLSRIFLNEDLHVITEVLNQDLNGCRSSRQLLFNDLGFFSERVDFHRACTNFVLRYRALWDKIMGTLILLLCSEEYHKFWSKHSRLKAFLNIMREARALPEQECRKIDECVTEFNNRFRTAEAHGSGILRKWTFVVQNQEDNPIEDFLWASNTIDEYFDLISIVLERFWISKTGGEQECAEDC